MFSFSPCRNKKISEICFNRYSSDC